MNGGTLVVNGNQASATGNVTVANAANLGGTGTIGGAVTVNSGGTLFSGNGTTTSSTIGTLTVHNSVTVNGTQVWKIAANASPTPSATAGGSDGTRGVTQDLLNLTGGANTIATNGVFKIVENGLALTNTSNYNFTVATTAGSPTAAPSSFDTTNALDFANYISANGSNSIALMVANGNEYISLTSTATPEPQHILLVCVSFAMLGLAVRRRIIRKSPIVVP